MTTLCTVDTLNRVMSSARVTMAVNVLQVHRTQTGTGNRFAWDARWSDFVVATHRKSTGPSPSEPSIADTPVTIESMESEHAESQTKTGAVLELFGATWGRSGGPKIDDGNANIGHLIPFKPKAPTQENERFMGLDEVNQSVGLPDFSWMTGQFARLRGQPRQSSPRGVMGRLHGMRSRLPASTGDQTGGFFSDSTRMTRLLLGLQQPTVLRN